MCFLNLQDKVPNCVYEQRDAAEAQLYIYIADFTIVNPCIAGRLF